MSLESNVELDVVAWAENHGWLVRKIAYIGRKGCPDRLFIGYGQRIVIEFKRSGGDPDPLQSREHRRWAAVGSPVPVVDNAEDGKAILLDYMGNVPLL